jgi:hypothetical protein
MAAVLFALTGAGLLRGRRRPTRVLAAISCVLLGVASVLAVAGIERTLRFLDVGGVPAWFDLLFAVLMPVGCVCSFVAAGTRLWKAPNPLLLRRRSASTRQDPPSVSR